MVRTPQDLHTVWVGDYFQQCSDSDVIGGGVCCVGVSGSDTAALLEGLNTSVSLLE